MKKNLKIILMLFLGSLAVFAIIFPLEEYLVSHIDNLDNQFFDWRKNKEKNSFSKTEMADINNDSFLEEYKLEGGILKIKENSKLIWQSPEEWWIDNFVIADSTNDGIKDINLSVWKSGSYGSAKPFWIKEEDKSIKNHFFIFDLDNDEIVSVWQSSNLSAPNCEFDIKDINGDGENELITSEGDYSDSDCKSQYIGIWKWDEWGFTNIERNKI